MNIKEVRGDGERKTDMRLWEGQERKASTDSPPLTKNTQTIPPIATLNV